MSISWRRAVRAQGRSRQNWNAPGINPTSVVHISAAEISSEPGHLFGTGQQFVYHLGDANVWVSNISPHAGGVEYILHVDWNEPLPVGITITLEPNPPVETQNL